MPQRRSSNEQPPEIVTALRKRPTKGPLLADFQKRLDDYVKNVPKRVPKSPPVADVEYTRTLKLLGMPQDWRPVAEGVWGVRLSNGVKALAVHDHVVLKWPTVAERHGQACPYFRFLLNKCDPPELPVAVKGGIRAQMHEAAFAHAEKMGAFAPPNNVVPISGRTGSPPSPANGAHHGHDGCVGSGPPVEHPHSAGGVRDKT